MPIIGWIRDLFGIQKDMYETKKTRLEIEKIEDEKREKLITPATLADVKKYDAARRKVIAAAFEEDRKKTHFDLSLSIEKFEYAKLRRQWRRRRRVTLLLCALALILLITLLVFRYSR